MKAVDRRLRTILGYAIGLVALVVVARMLGLRGGEIAAAITAIPLSSVLLAWALFALHMTLNALAFASLTNGLVDRAPTRALAYAWLASLPAKYVPGGVWHVVGRGLLMSRLGIGRAAVVVGGVLEQASSLAWCLLLAGCFALAPAIGLPVSAIGGAVVAASAAWLLPLLLQRLRPGTQRRYLRRTWLLHGLAMLPFAGAYLLLADPIYAWNFLAAIFAGTVVGVLAILVPGGLGVRESAAALFYGPVEPAELMGALLVGRLLLLLCDLLGAAVGQLAIRRPDRAR